MAKKRRLIDMKSHEHALAMAKEATEKQARKEEFRRARRGSDTVMKDKPRKMNFRYKRHMRIDGITPKNKTHARELWEAKWGKRRKDADDMDIEEDTRSKKRRKIERVTGAGGNASLEYDSVEVDGMGLESGIMKTTMTIGSNKKSSGA